VLLEELEEEAEESEEEEVEDAEEEVEEAEEEAGGSVDETDEFRERLLFLAFTAGGLETITRGLQ